MRVVVVLMTGVVMVGLMAVVAFPIAMLYAFPLRLAARWVVKLHVPYWSCFWTSYIYLVAQGVWGLVLVMGMVVLVEGSAVAGPITALMVMGYAFIQAYTLSKRLQVTPTRAICVMLVQTALIIPVALLVGVVYSFISTMPIW